MKRHFAPWVILCFLAAGPAVAIQPGHLDPGFGVAGKRTVAANLDAFSPLNVSATVVGPDNHIYMVGSIVTPLGQSVLAIARLQPDGMLDDGFGEAGVALHADGFNAVLARDAAFDPQGRLVVVGQGADALGTFGILVCRFEANGAPDVAFGKDATPGCLLIPGSSSSIAEAVAIQACAVPENCIDGQRIVLAGAESSNGQLLGVVIGVRSDGAAKDVNFADNGKASIPLADEFDFPTYFTDLSVGLGGELAAGGYLDSMGPGGHDFLVYRLDADGEPVSDFGSNTVAGAMFLEFNLGPPGSTVDEAHAVRLLDDGSVLLAGVVQTGLVDYRPAVIKFAPDGEADPIFNGSGGDPLVVESHGAGQLTYTFCGDTCEVRAEDVDVLADGSIVLAGSIADGVSGDSNFDLARKREMFALRLHPNGAPDPGFRSPDSAFGGLATVGFNLVDGQSEDAAFGLVVQGDRLLVSGVAATPDAGNDELDDYHFAIARLGNRVLLFADGFEDPL